MPIGRMEFQAAYPELDMEGQNIQLGYSCPKAELNIERSRGGLNIQTRQPVLEVDAGVCNAEEGHETTAESCSQFAEEGKQAVLDSEEEANQWGEVCQQSLRSKNALASYHLNKAVPGMADTTITFIPSQLPHVAFTDPVNDTEYEPDRLNYDWNTHTTADITVERPNSLSITLSQYPELHMEYVEPLLNAKA